jgi:hypothetical protein
MSETPESTSVNVPAETQAAKQSELHFEAVEPQNELQLEMCFETNDTPVETPNEPHPEAQTETRVEAQNETRFEMVETQAEAQIEAQNEALNEAQNGMLPETVEGGVEIQLETPPERRAERLLETRTETPIVMQTETQVETPVGLQSETRVEIQNEKPAEPRAVTRPDPQAATLNDRPFRVKLRGSVLVLIKLPNKRQLRAALHQLSTTGGVINLEKPLDEKIVVELIFHIDRSTIRGKAQMLFPMWATQGWMQPFRFVELTDTDRNALQENLQTFIGNLAKGASASS